MIKVINNSRRRNNKSPQHHWIALALAVPTVPQVMELVEEERRKDPKKFSGILYFQISSLVNVKSRLVQSKRFRWLTENRFMAVFLSRIGNL